MTNIEIGRVLALYHTLSDSMQTQMKRISIPRILSNTSLKYIIDYTFNMYGSTSRCIEVKDNLNSLSPKLEIEFIYEKEK